MTSSFPRPRSRSFVLDLLVVGAPLSILYLLTLSRDLGVIDSGELATVCTRLGVAHPTGYPLYTLLGRIMVLILPESPIFAVNLFSALAALAASLVTVRIARRWIGVLGVGESDGLLRPDLWLPWAAGLWIGTNRVLWEQATGNEVYSLQVFFAALVVGGLISIAAGERSTRSVGWTAYWGGLAFAHHLTTAFLLPASLLAAFWVVQSRARLRSVLAIFGFGLLGWSANLYLPIRSAAEPILDWGDPSSWSGFWSHYLANQYRVWHFQSSEQFTANLGMYLASLPARLTWPVLLLAIPGLASLRASRPEERRAAWILVLVFSATVFWASGYEIHDLAPYYLSADLALVLLASAGTIWALRALTRVAPLARGAVVAVAVAALVWQSWKGTDELDRSDDHFIRTHCEVLFEGMPEGTILLSAFWDAVVSPSLYMQEVEGYRRDVTVVDPELLRRVWYIPQLRRWDAPLLAPVEDRIERLNEDLIPFNTGGEYDPRRIEANYRALIHGIAHSHAPGRPTAHTPDLPGRFAAPFSPVPEGLVYFLREDPASSPPISPPDVDRLMASGYRPSDRIHGYIVDHWKTLIRNRIKYLDQFGRTAEIPEWQSALTRLETVRPGASLPTRP